MARTRGTRIDQQPQEVQVSGEALSEAFDTVETDVPMVSRGLEAEIVALRKTIDELIFILKLVHDV